MSRPRTEPARRPRRRRRKAGAGAAIVCRPLTPGRWPDLVRLFGPRGACGGCWCMHWRLKRSDYERRKGDGNRRALKAIVDAGRSPGLLAYAGSEPVAWCAVSPREALPTLERSRVLARLDDTPVWSVVCLFVARGRRGQGITGALLRAAVEHVRRRGGKVLEGYPVEPRSPRLPDVFAFTGLASAFRKAGFVEAGRRSATRPIMRLRIG